LYKIRVLASTSKGNSTFIRINDTAFLIDVGISAKQIIKRLKDIGEDISGVSGVIISHEHTDHTKGIKTLFKSNPHLKCWCSWDTYKKISKKTGSIDAEFIDIGEPFTLGHNSIQIIPFENSHDAADPLIFRIDVKGKPFIGYVMDCGFTNSYIIDGFQGVKVLILESNHSFDQLLRSKYPNHLKERILGRKGHLSNWASAEFLYAIKPRLVLLVHLSEENNSPQIALSEIETVLAMKGSDFQPFLVFAPNGEPCTLIKGKLL